MAEVELRGITALYNDVVAVDDVSLTIPAGAFVTLLGPSGCGKSSTLRIVAGLLQPDSGRVLFDGRDVTRLPAARRNIGMVFQSLALFPHMTAAENVAFGLRMRKVPPAEQKKRALDALEMVQLGHMADRYPRRMSGGQQQRVALARAIVTEPSILILDEPFAALDRNLREAMQIELRSLTRKLGITALFVTHDQEEALMLSDFVAVMRSGKIEQFDTPTELYRSPRTQYVADFMGVTNFLAGRIVACGSGGSRIEIAGTLVDGPPAGAPATSGGSVIVAVRPERIEIAALDGAGEAAPAMAGLITQTTFHGNTSRHSVDLDCGLSVVVFDTSEPERRGYREGSRVRVRWDPGAAQLFHG